MGSFTEIVYPNDVLRSAYEDPAITIFDAMSRIYEPALKAVEGAGFTRGDAYGAYVADELGVEATANEAAAAQVLQDYVEANKPLPKIADVMARATLLIRLSGGLRHLIDQKATSSLRPQDFWQTEHPQTPIGQHATLRAEKWPVPDWLDNVASPPRKIFIPGNNKNTPLTQQGEQS